MKITQALIQTLAILGAATSTNAASLRGAEENASQPAQPYQAPKKKWVRESVHAKQKGEESNDMVAYLKTSKKWVGEPGNARHNDVKGGLMQAKNKPPPERKNGTDNIQSLKRIEFYPNEFDGNLPDIKHGVLAHGILAHGRVAPAPRKHGANVELN